MLANTPLAFRPAPFRAPTETAWLGADATRVEAGDPVETYIDIAGWLRGTRSHRVIEKARHARKPVLGNSLLAGKALARVVAGVGAPTN
jgi:hypothetical protein